MEAEVEKEVLELLREITDLCGIVVKNQRKILTLQTIIHNEILSLSMEDYEMEERYGNC